MGVDRCWHHGDWLRFQSCAVPSRSLMNKHRSRLWKSVNLNRNDCCGRPSHSTTMSCDARGSRCSIFFGLVPASGQGIGACLSILSTSIPELHTRSSAAAFLGRASTSGATLIDVFSPDAAIDVDTKERTITMVATASAMTPRLTALRRVKGVPRTQSCLASFTSLLGRRLRAFFNTRNRRYRTLSNEEPLAGSARGTHRIALRVEEPAITSGWPNRPSASTVSRRTLGRESRSAVRMTSRAATFIPASSSGVTATACTNTDAAFPRMIHTSLLSDIEIRHGTVVVPCAAIRVANFESGSDGFTDKDARLTWIVPILEHVHGFAELVDVLRMFLSVLSGHAHMSIGFTERRLHKPVLTIEQVE